MLNEQLEAHREKESCNNCHRGIDPWGLPLENFDALGHWRQSSNTASTLPNGSTISNASELKRFLVTERKEWFARSLVRRVMVYALGRSLDLGDREPVGELTQSFVNHGYRIQPLIVDLVSSEAFLAK